MGLFSAACRPRADSRQMEASQVLGIHASHPESLPRQGRVDIRQKGGASGLRMPLTVSPPAAGLDQAPVALAANAVESGTFGPSL